MLVFVDFEHADGHTGEHGPRLLAARTRITYRLEDVSGMHCHLVRYDRVDQQLLDRLSAKAIFISGNSSHPDIYSPDDLEPISALVRETELPVFGLCGGFQLLAQALGSPLMTLDQRPDLADDDAVVTTGDGRVFEFGYHPVDLTSAATEHPLCSGLGGRPVFRHAHALHVPEPPDGFDTFASTPATPVQMAVHADRRIVGTQFHPEYWTDDHPAGRTLIANFLRWAEVGATATAG